MWLSSGEHHESSQSSEADSSKQMERPVCPRVPLFVFPSPFVCWFVYFWFPYNGEPLELRVWRGLDIIWWWQWMRGDTMGQDPPGVPQGPAQAGCQELLRGPDGTSLQHLTSALQLSPALTLSRLESHMELRSTSGTWSVSLCHFIRRSN